MQTLCFHMEEFDGPLDLLLALVAKNKMTLDEIEILSIIDQYLDVVRSWDKADPDAASEFIEMAARLVQMKSYFLLPKSEEAERLRAELTGMLVEYSLCKEVAAKLRVMAENTFTAVREPAEIEPDYEYRLRHDVYVLEQAYNAMQGRSVRRQEPDAGRFDPIVTAPFVSVTSRIVRVLRDLVTGRAKSLRQLFSRNAGRSQTVATFLAVLELMRAGRVEIGGDGSLAVRKNAAKGEENTWNSDN